jgi:signal transduction histidine kinase
MQMAESRSKAELRHELELLRGKLARIEAADAGHEERRRALEGRLFRQREALVRLGLSEELARGDFARFVKLAVRVSADTLDVARVSVWQFNEDGTVLQCEQLYEKESGLYSKGDELLAERHPRYFEALRRGRQVAAHDAHQDSATSEFSQDYLTPLGITSMLDAPLRQSGRLVGVVCHEHVGPARVWAPEEQDFASSVADFITLVLEARERRRAERAFRSAQEELLRRQWQATKQVESELARARGQQERRARVAVVGQVAASISQELRRPLEAIRNAVELLAPGSDPCRSVDEDPLAVIAEEVAAAESILDNLSQVACADQPHRELLDLSAAIDEAVRSVPEASDVRIELDLEPRPFNLEADPGQLRRVLANLVRNAVQAMGPRGRIEVRARSEGDTACITLRDDGPGVPRDQRARIFEPLFSSRPRGTGLGLQICRQILGRHGGSIELVEDARPGAAFLLRIPGPAEDAGASR